jgi:hypothetical protein
LSLYNFSPLESQERLLSKTNEHGVACPTNYVII